MDQSDRIAREGDRVSHLEECWNCARQEPPVVSRAKVLPDDDDRAQNTVRLYECRVCGYYWERWRGEQKRWSSTASRLDRQTTAFTPTDKGYHYKLPDEPLTCDFRDDGFRAYGDTSNCADCKRPEIRAFHHRAKTLLEAARRCARRGCTGKPREPIEGENGRVIRCDKCGEPWQRSKKKRR